MFLFIESDLYTLQTKTTGRIIYDMYFWYETFVKKNSGNTTDRLCSSSTTSVADLHSNQDHTHIEQHVLFVCLTWHIPFRPRVSCSAQNDFRGNLKPTTLEILLGEISLADLLSRHPSLHTWFFAGRELLRTLLKHLPMQSSQKFPEPKSIEQRSKPFHSILIGEQGSLFPGLVIAISIQLGSCSSPTYSKLPRC